MTRPTLSCIASCLAAAKQQSWRLLFEASFIHHINADVGLVGLQVTSEVVNPRFGFKLCLGMVKNMGNWEGAWSQVP